ncbi:MAG: hypothetical protein ACR2IE_20245 [Candidatus Sumerlaeaceae bacterium]
MTPAASDRVDRIRTALEGAGLKWLFNAPDANERARGLAQEFDEAEQFYNKRTNKSPDLLSVVEANPDAYAPFLQSIGLPLSKEMRTVILRLIEGMEIRVARARKLVLLGRGDAMVPTYTMQWFLLCS